MRNPDNAPEKKTEYEARLKALTDHELFEECKRKIWLSAYAGNNPNSCFHWQCDFTYDEASRRDKEDIYARAHTAVSRSV